MTNDKNNDRQTDKIGKNLISDSGFMEREYSLKKENGKFYKNLITSHM